MWTRRLLKENGLTAFQRNYWACVGASFLAMFLGGGMAAGSYNFNFDNTENAGSIDATYSGGGIFSPESNMHFGNIPVEFWYIAGTAAIIGLIIGLGFSLFVSNVVAVGCNRYFLENREHKTSVGQVFYSFQDGRYGTTVWVMFLRTLYILGWTLLFVIPGIVKSYSYMLVPYILAENPHMDKDRVFELSSQMMRGHKLEAFELNLSFIGWYLLGAFTFGMVDIFYTSPYVNATFAEFYSALKAEATGKGIVFAGELPGVDIQEG